MTGILEDNQNVKLLLEKGGFMAKILAESMARIAT
jgi:hypothetical protein